ncbi:hypothetical protein HY631_03390 [Candidatus Uhrbacteria bacterium]|nr:hypothetical protein [Candidatus Uhrbacteria bacterium]
MSVPFSRVRESYNRLRQSRVRYIAAHARLLLGDQERAQRKFREAQKELGRAFDAGLELLSGATARLVREQADEPAALEQVLGQELLHQARRSKKQLVRVLRRMKA